MPRRSSVLSAAFDSNPPLTMLFAKCVFCSPCSRNLLIVTMTTLKRKPLSRMNMLLWRLCVLLFVCISALVPATPVFAGAKPPSDRTEQNAKFLRLNLQDLLENWHKLSEVAQLDAVEQIIAQGKADIALQILEQANFKNGASNIRARFLRGLALKGRGENQAAIEIFRQLLADNPNFSRVRLNLHTPCSWLKRTGALSIILIWF